MECQESATLSFTPRFEKNILVGPAENRAARLKQKHQTGRTLLLSVRSDFIAASAVRCGGMENAMLSRGAAVQPQDSGICLYRSLYAALRHWLRIPVAEHRLFFLSDGFGVRYQAIAQGEPVTRSIQYEENEKVISALAKRLGISCRYHPAPVETPHDIAAAALRREPVLLFTHVDALPYDPSGAVRSDAYHCIRVLHLSASHLIYADDFVPKPCGGYGTRVERMDFEANQSFFMGYLSLSGGEHAQLSDDFGSIFRGSIQRFLRGGCSQDMAWGITAVTRFLSDCRMLAERKFSERQCTDLMMILKYQWYAAYGYLLSACQDLRLLPARRCPQLDKINASWRVCFLSLHAYLTSGRKLFFRRFLSCAGHLGEQLTAFLTSILEQ